MDHPANDVLGTLTIAGPEPQRQLLQLVGRAKGRQLDVQQDSSPWIEEQGTTIKGLWPALMYLEERYPHPSLLPQMVTDRSIVRSVVDQLFEAPNDVLPSIVEHRKHPFFFGDSYSLIDLALVATQPEREQFAKVRAAILLFLNIRV